MIKPNVKILSPQSQSSFVSGWYDLALATHFWMEGRLCALLQQFKRNNVPVNEMLKGLEVGCGQGVLRSQIEQHTNWIIDGTDLDLSSLQNNPSCRGEVYLYNVFDRQASLRDHYDFIIIYDVIEHIDDVDAFLNACLFHLKPGGYVFINVPALEFLTSQYDKVVGHLRRYDTQMLTKQICDVGLKPIHVNYWGFLFVPLLLCRKILVGLKSRSKSVVQDGFSPKNSLLNGILKTLIKVEVSILPNPILGTSVMAIAQKS